MWQRVSTVPVQMWQGRPGPDADVAGASPVPEQMWLGSKATGGYRRSALCRCAVVALLLFCDRSSDRPIRRVLGRRGSFRRAPAQQVGDRLNAHLPTDPIGASSRTRAQTHARTHARTRTHTHARTHARTCICRWSGAQGQRAFVAKMGATVGGHVLVRRNCSRRLDRVAMSLPMRHTRHGIPSGTVFHPARYPTQQYPAQHGTWSGGAMRLETGYGPAHRRGHRRLRRSLGRAHTQRCP